ncbi:MAG: hypothetical protein D6831_02600, partial [Aquificota bacterium]
MISRKAFVYILLFFLFKILSASAEGDPLVTIYRASGPYKVELAGGSFRDKDNSTDCASIVDRSSYEVSLPTGAKVKKAYLFWAASGNNVDSTVTLNNQSITSNNCHQASYIFKGTSYKYYGCYTDVTAFVETQGNGIYELKDLTIENGSPWKDVCGVAGTWFLVIVYEDATYKKNVTIHGINIYEGFELIRNNTFNDTISDFVMGNPVSGYLSYYVSEGDS